MHDPHIEIYGRPDCTYCDQARALCEKQGYPFTYYDIAADEVLRNEFVTRTNGAQTVPQIFIGIHRVGGFDQLAAAERAGVLQSIFGGK